MLYFIALFFCENELRICGIVYVCMQLLNRRGKISHKADLLRIVT